MRCSKEICSVRTCKDVLKAAGVQLVVVARVQTKPHHLQVLNEVFFWFVNALRYKHRHWKHMRITVPNLQVLPRMREGEILCIKICYPCCREKQTAPVPPECWTWFPWQICPAQPAAESWSSPPVQSSCCSCPAQTAEQHRWAWKREHSRSGSWTS